MEPDPRGYTNAKAPGYANDPYHPSNAPPPDEEEDFYEDEQPSRRRMGVEYPRLILSDLRRL